MKKLVVVIALASAVAGVACLTSYNRYKWTALADAPQVSPRPDGCNVDVFEDGSKVPRPHADLGNIVLEWPAAKLQEQGPEGAIATLKAAACENGAFIIKDMRALSTGEDRGMVYEATFATLLGDDGKPINLKGVDAGPEVAAPAPAASAAPASGW
jgi:hypothetical protein